MSQRSEDGATARPEPGADADTRSAVAGLLAPLTAYLDDIAVRAADRLEPVAGVAITMSVRDVPLTVGASSQLARDVDLIQYEIGTGPCLHALRNGVGLYVPDLAADTRWGEYGPQAAARGARSCVSVPVLHEGVPAAVLKAYSADVDGLIDEQRAGVLSFVPEVSGGVGLALQLARQARTIDDRTAAMSTRRVIDLAIGIVMERLHIDADTAFALLRNMSQTTNVKLREVAGAVVAGLPAAAAPTADAPFRERR